MHGLDPDRRLRVSRAAVALLTLIVASSCGPVPPPTPVPSTDFSAQSLPPATATASSAPALDPDAGWSLVPLGDTAVASFLTDVVATPSGFLVAGMAGQAGEKPVILQSIDGQTWKSEGIESPFGRPDRLVAWGERVVAVGGGGTSQCAHPSALDTWVRAPGAKWTEAPFDQAFCVGSGNETLLERAGHLVIVGAGTGDVAYLMTSDDGLTWSSHINPFGDTYPLAAASDNSGLWVFGSNPAGVPVAMRSADGRTFEPPSLIPGLGPEAGITSAVTVAGQVVAVVTEGSEVGILRAANGGGWSGEAATGLSADEMGRIVGAGDRLVALGSDADGRPLAWASSNGTSWSPMILPAQAVIGTTLTGIASANGTAVLVGQVTLQDGSSAVGAIWVGSSALLGP